jgi:hypothetical protein
LPHQDRTKLVQTETSMLSNTETEEIKKCLSKIEDNLSWGSSEAWTSYDFEKLSEAILEKTSVRLSNTTLKRVWGRIKYEHAPTTATLNTLAKFAGYMDWRGFVQSGNGIDIKPEPKNIISEAPAFNVEVKKNYLPVRILALAVLLSVAGYFIYQKGFASRAINTSDFSFKADKVMAEGVPNSVIFTYDASKAKTDSVYIVQTWDIRRKTLVPKNQTKHSAIYHYPGYFRTRLLVDGEVVKSHDLQITSNGWLGLVENDDNPFYFEKKDITKPGMIEIDEALLKANHFDLKPNTPIRFFNQGDMGDLMNDNFEFETTLRNNYNGGNNACQYVEVLIQCKDDIIIIPLLNPACVGDAHLYIAGKEFHSKYADLSGFGCDLSGWATLHIICKEKAMQLFVNNKKAFECVFPHQPTGIVGVQYRFNGTGAIKNTWFRDRTKRHIPL